MVDMEKIIKGLNCCINYSENLDYDCSIHGCPYADREATCITDLQRDTLALLKAQKQAIEQLRGGYIENLITTAIALKLKNVSLPTDAALEMVRRLKAQEEREPVTPKMMEFVDKGCTWEKYEVPVCGVCGALLGDARFCPMCGQEVKWDD